MLFHLSFKGSYLFSPEFFISFFFPFIDKTLYGILVINLIFITISFCYLFLTSIKKCSHLFLGVFGICLIAVIHYRFAFKLYKQCKTQLDIYTKNGPIDWNLLPGFYLFSILIIYNIFIIIFIFTYRILMLKSYYSEIKSLDSEIEASFIKSTKFLQLLEYRWNFLEKRMSCYEVDVNRLLSYKIAQSYNSIMYNNIIYDSMSYYSASVCHKKQNNYHKAQTKCKFLPLPCSWSRLRIRVDMSLYENNFFQNRTNLKLLSILNTMNFHILTPYNFSNFIDNSQSECLLDNIQQLDYFDKIFPKIYIYLIESLAIREDGLSLINQFIKKLKSPDHKLIIRCHVLLDTFRIWPPPLWYQSLLKIRYIIKKYHKQKILYKLFKVPLKDTILESSICNPLKNHFNLDIFSVLKLSFHSLWTNDDFICGIFERLSI